MILLEGQPCYAYPSWEFWCVCGQIWGSWQPWWWHFTGVGESAGRTEGRIFLKNTGVNVYAVDITDESEDGESSGSVIDFYGLKLTVFPETLINNPACRWLVLKTQCRTLCMTLVASCWAVKFSMGTSRVIRGMRLATECNFRRPYMVDASW